MKDSIRFEKLKEKSDHIENETKPKLNEKLRIPKVK